MTDSRILVEREGGIAWLTINNPEQRNAITLQMRLDMTAAFAELDADPEARVVVIGGAGGKSFTAGNYIPEFEKYRSDPELSRYFDETSAAYRKQLNGFSKPMIAMIDGFALGGGLGLALGCDLRYASEGSEFGVPAARLGIAYSLESLEALAAVVGVAFAKEIMFTGGRISSDEALRIGLVNAVVPREKLKDHVRAIAAQIAVNAPLSIRSSKVVLSEIARARAAIGLPAIKEAIDACNASEDIVEGRRAFMEKRPPVFRGR